MKELYKALKDHKNQHMENLGLSSYRHCYTQEARKVMGNDNDFIDTQDLEECGKENVVRVTIINKKFEPSLASAVERLIEAKLQIDKFRFKASSITAQPPSPMVQNDEKRRRSSQASRCSTSVPPTNLQWTDGYQRTNSVACQTHKRVQPHG